MCIFSHPPIPGRARGIIVWSGKWEGGGVTELYKSRAFSNYPFVPKSLHDSSRPRATPNTHAHTQAHTQAQAHTH